MRIGIYAGQYYDQETELHYNYHRYYDAQTGRYLSPDPIRLAGGINLFVYALDNPVNLIDPFGLNSVRDPYTGQRIPVPDDITYIDLYKILQHWVKIRIGQGLSRRDQAPEYDMLKRLNRGEVTVYDYEFYMHEIIEKDIMEQKYGGCYSYKNLKKAHEEALKIRGITDYDLWHPDVRRKYRKKGGLWPLL